MLVVCVLTMVLVVVCSMYDLQDDEEGEGGEEEDAEGIVLTSTYIGVHSTSTYTIYTPYILMNK